MNSNKVRTSSSQNYCLTKILNQAQLFGDSKRQSNKFDLIAEDKFVGQVFKRVEIQLPSTLRLSHLQSQCTISADGKFVASTHADNKIYISDLTTAKVVNVLDGHSRGIWSLCYHPVHNHILASGCQAGQVKIWDLKNNASQEWTNHQQIDNQNVGLHPYHLQTSISFHPTEDILAIALNNFIFFWNWRSGDKEDFVSIHTGDIKQRIKLVRFDTIGRLIIGISNDLSSSVDHHYLRMNSLINNLNNLSNALNNNNNSMNNNSSLNTNSTNNNNSTSATNLIGNPSSSSSSSLHSSASSLFSLNSLNQSERIFISRNNNSQSNDAAFRLSDEYFQQNEISILRSEALFSLANAIADSIQRDNSMPENLPSFSYLQRNYQTESTPVSLFQRVMRYYRRLENEINSESNDELSNSDSFSRESIEITNNNERRRNSLLTPNRQQSQTAPNDEELNVIMESINFVDSIINRYRSTLQDNNENSNSSTDSSSSHLNFSLRRRYQNQFRRRLSAYRHRTRLWSSAFNNSNNNSPTNITTEANTTRQNDQATLFRPVIDRVANVGSGTLNEQQIYDSNSSSINNNSSIGGGSSGETNTENNQTRSIRQILNQNSSQLRSSSTNNHLRFYTLLQHQASRSTNSLNHQQPTSPTQQNNSSSSSTSSNATSSQMILINRIQNSINAINRASSSSLGDVNYDEIQQLSNNGNSVLQRLIYYTNYRDKLINLRNRIRFMSLESSENMASIRSELGQCYSLVSMLIVFVDAMNRILCTDLRVSQLSLMYLMRTSSNNNSSNTPQQLSSIIDLSNDSNDSTSQQASTSSSSSLNDGFEIEDDNPSTPIASTSTGITKRKHRTVNSSTDDARQTTKRLKLKIPLVKINDTETKSPVESTSLTSETSNELNSDPTSTNSRANNRDLLRTEMNSHMSSLLTNLENLTELLGSSSNHSRIGGGLQMSNLLSGNFPIQRINNPMFNFVPQSGGQRIFITLNDLSNNNNLINNTTSNLSNNNGSNNNTNNNHGNSHANNHANNFPMFNVFVPANQWSYSEYNHVDHLNCRIEIFDFNRDRLPNLENRQNSVNTLVVSKCKIQNESSVDISRNVNGLLCCLVPSSDGSSDLCVYSTKKSNLGQCLFIYCSCSSTAISVSFSPSSKYIITGFSQSRFNNYYNAADENTQIAQIFVLSEDLANCVRAKELEDFNNNRTKEQDEKPKHKAIELLPLKPIFQNDDLFSLNCIKWLPTKDGLVYTNGQSLILCRGSEEVEWFYHQHMSNNNKLNIKSGKSNSILYSLISPLSNRTMNNRTSPIYFSI